MNIGARIIALEATVTKLSAIFRALAAACGIKLNAEGEQEAPADGEMTLEERVAALEGASEDHESRIKALEEDDGEEKPKEEEPAAEGEDPEKKDDDEKAAFQAAVSAEVSRQLAGVGLSEPVRQPAPSGGAIGAETGASALLAEFEKITDPTARAAFMLKHEKAISAAIRKLR